MHHPAQDPGRRRPRCCGEAAILSRPAGESGTDPLTVTAYAGVYNAETRTYSARRVQRAHQSKEIIHADANYISQPKNLLVPIGQQLLN